MSTSYTLVIAMVRVNYLPSQWLSTTNKFRYLLTSINAHILRALPVFVNKSCNLHLHVQLHDKQATPASFANKSIIAHTMRISLCSVNFKTFHIPARYSYLLSPALPPTCADQKFYRRV